MSDPISGRFHHTGYVVPSIADCVAGFQSALSLDWDGVIVHDPLQMVRVTFLPANRSDCTTGGYDSPRASRRACRANSNYIASTGREIRPESRPGISCVSN